MHGTFWLENLIKISPKLLFQKPPAVNWNRFIWNHEIGWSVPNGVLWKWIGTSLSKCQKNSVFELESYNCLWFWKNLNQCNVYFFSKFLTQQSYKNLCKCLQFFRILYKTFQLFVKLYTCLQFYINVMYPMSPISFRMHTNNNSLYNFMNF